jgi:hypothetical protein
MVVEQTDGWPFNRGSLLNIGMLLADPNTDRVALHDVDMLPLDEECDYSSTEGIRHLAGGAEQFGFALPYRNYLGGVLLGSLAAMKAVNGYSNRYWGWGCEDDDLCLRFWAQGIEISRRKGKYRSLNHPRAAESADNGTVFSDVLKTSLRMTGTSGGPVHPRVFRRAQLERFESRESITTPFVCDGLSSVVWRLSGRFPLRHCLPFVPPISHAHEMLQVELLAQ